MHPAQVQGVLAMIDGLAQQIQALRNMVAGAQPRRQGPPPPSQQFLSDQEESLLDQAMGVPAAALHGQFAPQHAQAPWQGQPQQFPPQQTYPQQQYQQPGGQVGQVPPGWTPPQYAGGRPYHMPNNLNEMGPLAEAQMPQQVPQMPPNQRAVMEIFRQAAQNGALEPQG